MRTLICSVLALALGTLMFPRLSQGDEKSQKETVVAGRNLEGWTADLDSSNEFVRLRAVKSLRPFGADATSALVAALQDKNAGVRYWAASHLGDIGKPAAASLATVRQHQKTETNPGVAMAMAYALCRLEKTDDHIDLLVQRLNYPERGMACSAAEFLGKLGPDGASATDALEKVFRRKGVDYHLRGACQNALRKIKPDWKP